jgi:hypothetical protein
LGLLKGYHDAQHVNPSLNEVKSNCCSVKFFPLKIANIKHEPTSPKVSYYKHNCCNKSINFKSASSSGISDSGFEEQDGDMPFLEQQEKVYLYMSI